MTMPVTLTPTRIERMALRNHCIAGISRSTTELRGHKAGGAPSALYQKESSLFIKLSLSVGQQLSQSQFSGSEQIYHYVCRLPQ